MTQVEHPQDKFILTQKKFLEELPEDNLIEFDTTQLQIACLEKFANSQGYTFKEGLIRTQNPAQQVISLPTLVALYNETMKRVGYKLHGTGLIETVYLSGRSFRRNVRVMCKRVKFL